jgi:hypothetical protein
MAVSGKLVRVEGKLPTLKWGNKNKKDERHNHTMV